MKFQYKYSEANITATLMYIQNHNISHVKRLEFLIKDKSDKATIKSLALKKAIRAFFLKSEHLSP